jgi:hypothetical protein
MADRTRHDNAMISRIDNKQILVLIQQYTARTAQRTVVDRDIAEDSLTTRLAMTKPLYAIVSTISNIQVQCVSDKEAQRSIELRRAIARRYSRLIVRLIAVLSDDDVAISDRAIDTLLNIDKESSASPTH